MPAEDEHGETGVSTEVIETVADLLGEVGADETVYVIDPPEETVRAVIGAARALETPPVVRVVGGGKMLRRIRRDFLTASEAAGLVENGTLAFRTEPPEADQRLIATDGVVYSLLVADGAATYVTETDESFVATALSTSEAAWEAGEQFNLRTPGIESLAAEMEATFGPEFSQQFTEGLDVARRMRDRTEFDPVAASLLVAAHNRELHYDVSKLGEDTGLASKATYSRVKKRLEEDGIITTEKEQMDVGRPRQRLALAEQYRNIAADRGITELMAHILN